MTGGNDKLATVFNKNTQQVVAIMKGHTKKVTKVIYHPEPREEWETVITASPDSTIRVWNVPTLVFIRMKTTDIFVVDQLINIFRFFIFRLTVRRQELY